MIIWLLLIISFDNSLFVFDLCYNRILILTKVMISNAKHLQCKKGAPSKVESYLEVNTWAEWQQQDLISECGQGLAYWTQALHWTHSYIAIAGKVRLDQLICFQPYPVTNFIFQKINKRTWNSQLFAIWPPSCQGLFINKKAAKWQIIVNFMFSCWSFEIWNL